jgi:hypothetical protein
LSSYNPYGVNNYDRNLLKCFRPHQREQWSACTITRQRTLKLDFEKILLVGGEGK